MVTILSVETTEVIGNLVGAQIRLISLNIRYSLYDMESSERGERLIQEYPYEK